MVVAVDSPVRTDRLKRVDFTVFVRIGKFGNLGTLGEDERAVLIKHAEWFV